MPARAVPRPTKEKAARRTDLYLEPDSVHYHAERIKAVAKMLDDLQRGSLLHREEAGSLTQTVLLDGLVAVLLEDSTILEEASRKALKGIGSPTWTHAPRAPAPEGTA